MGHDAAGSDETTTAVLVPVKAFGEAKARLAVVLGPEQRAALARELAERVLAAAGDLPTAVVCDDITVATWAEVQGAEVVWCPGRGLNGAVQDAVRHLADRGVRRVVVAHADLPLVEDYDEVLTHDGVVLAPDRHGDGTNVAVVPTDLGFGFAYGPASFDRHRAEALRLGAPPTVVHSTRLSWDIDTPEDLQLPTAPAADALTSLA